MPSEDKAEEASEPILPSNEESPAPRAQSVPKSEATSPVVSSPPQQAPTRLASPDENEASAGKSGKRRVREEGEEPLKDLEKDENVEVPPAESASQTKKTSTKAGKKKGTGKRKAEGEVVAPAAVKKRKSVGGTGGDGLASGSSKLAPPVAKEEEEVEEEEEEEKEEEDELPTTKSKKGSKKRTASTSKPKGPSKKDRVAQLFALESPQKPGSSDDLVPEEIDAEMEGMIIECMASSRASSMPVSLVTRMVLQAHPGLKGQRTEKEWRRVMNRVLRNGATGRGSGVFGKVESSGKVCFFLFVPGLGVQVLIFGIG